MALKKYVVEFMTANVWCKHESRGIVASFSASIFEIENVKPIQKIHTR